MPAQTPCIKCHRVGLVRWEHVLRGNTAYIEYACGACDHTWRVVDTDSPPTPKAKPERARE